MIEKEQVAECFECFAGPPGHRRAVFELNRHAGAELPTEMRRMIEPR